MKTNMKQSFTDFEYRCLTNKWNMDEEMIEKIGVLWLNAETRDEFVLSLQQDETLRYTQACGVLSRGDRRFIRSMLPENGCITTSSDAGGVRIYCGSFEIIIPNGYGDGRTTVAVIHKGEKFNTDAMNYFTMIRGAFDIATSDCGERQSAWTNVFSDARYHIYYGGGVVVFYEI